jgi:hypothetical protein
MATFNRFDVFALDVLRAKHDFLSHTFRIALTNSAPSATNGVLSDISQIGSGGGYTPLVAMLSSGISGALANVTGSDVVFTATGGAMGPMRYAVLYNDSAVGKPLVSWWDYGTTFTLAPTEQLTVRFDAVNGIFTLS